MALRIALSEEATDLGVAFPAAYVRIEQLRLKNLPQGGRVNLTVDWSIYADEDARKSGARPVARKKTVLDIAKPGGETVSLADAYASLKALPELAEAEDC